MSYEILNKEWDDKGVKNRRTIDVQVMDLSDEIAYAAHDLEDSISMGHITLSEILYEFKISQKYKSMHPVLLKLIKGTQKFAGSDKNLTSSEKYTSILKKELTSKIVNILARDIKLIEEEGQEKLGFKNYSLLSEGLKKLVFKTILRKRNIQMYEKMGDKVISGLYAVYTDIEFNRGGILLPDEYRNDSDECMFKRSVVDYISGMMDSFAISEYKRYFGESSFKKLYSKQR
ncbi:MAG: hypothetical protein D3924_14450 [Candidatus Electrothrix sp. AR4]|nr:hypothetical protein [Candidatus Electrothrix sp. AR4]